MAPVPNSSCPEGEPYLSNRMAMLHDIAKQLGQQPRSRAWANCQVVFRDGVGMCVRMDLDTALMALAEGWWHDQETGAEWGRATEAHVEAA